MNRACRLLLATSALSLSASLVAAQEGVPGMGDNRPAAGNKLERVELTSRPQSDTDLRRKSPVAKQVYGREEMDKFGDTNVADVLKRLPGVNMQGGAPRMRGLGSGYTLILINGDPAPPGFDMSQLSPSQVERIEVTKAPTADQSAQAVAGAINIILKDAPRISQRDLRLGIGYSAVRPTPSATFTLGEKIGSAAVSVPLSFFQWRGQNDVQSTRRMPGSDGEPSSSVQQGEQANWGHGFNSAPRLNWKISDEESLTLQAFLQKGFWNNRSSYELVSSSPNAVLDDDSLSHGTWQNLRGNAVWSKRFNDEQKLELKGGVQHSRGTFDNQTFLPASQLRRAVGDNTDRGFTQAGKFGQLLGEDHSLTVGWDLEWRRREEERTVSEAGKPQLPDFDGQPFGARITRQALFVQDEWELSPQWSTYLGLRSERIITESRGLAEPVRNTSTVTTPLWHLNYKFDPKGKDLIRASLTRSYKAPDLNALLARPSLSSLFTDTSKPNTEISPDREGNPLLKPELATGLDVAYEKYLTGGGMFSVGVFHRKVNDLVRNVTSLSSVSWASVPRYVSRPTNFSKAQTTGLELEIKGRAAELMPDWFDIKTALNLRASLSYYKSKVDALPGPDNRLDGQQPWSGNLGFDYRFSGLPLVTGASLAYTPGYATQQTLSQTVEQSRSRALDMFAQWTFSKTLSMRVSANNLAPLDAESQTLLSSGYGSGNVRKGRSFFGINLEMKL
ncbi:TonB-dependent receptor plug domain-containing protein [Roseateles sp.]|uniref:TonB-dependent receptor plug domain-containing protein n=1 Tax=Roseateles sp. TaxID=1971397 RepID=UPI003D0EAAC3